LSEEETKAKLRREFIHAGLLLTILSSHLVNADLAIDSAREKARNLMHHYVVGDALDLATKLISAEKSLDYAFNVLRQVMEKLLHMICMVK